jgi:hypothetical protein
VILRIGTGEASGQSSGGLAFSRIEPLHSLEEDR